MNPKASMFHTFATEGFAAWAELFLEAIRFHYGDRAHVLLDGYGLSDETVELLSGIHSNLRIRNRQADYEALADRAGVAMDTVWRWKREIEDGIPTDENFWFKSFISDDQRYRSMDDVIRYAHDNGFAYLVHADADIYIRRRLDRLGEALEDHDVGLFIRETRDQHKPLGAFLAFRIGPGALSFVDTWMAEIDSVPFEQRRRGWGQIILRSALDRCERVSVCNLSEVPSAISYSKRYDKDAHLWLGSNSKGKYRAKTKPRRACWDDLKAGLPRIEPETTLTARDLLPRVLRST